MMTVKEDSTCFVTITFRDHNGVLVTPSELSFRVDDIGKNRELLGWSTVAPTGSSHTIELTDENRIVDRSAPFEERLVTYRWTYEGTKRGRDEYRYRVQNLSKIY